MVGPVTFRLHAIPVERRAQIAAKDRPASLQAAVAEQISPQFSATRLADLARALAEAGPPVDHARIAQLRQAIAHGGYAVDAGGLAEALLRQLAV